ncbi:Crp/Fnr family transcriptional regulator [Pelagimonas varians]|uniref:Transcriptional activatory protein AadR n=1 Tax=Pelagimonas varians TaxID=696760 RepID=A0A238K0K4_9RHOB|nr:cyclic nucleotide-binding domain-containing protein [Pelagimonas varians]PYG33341.1 CRP-like cAMP-binding protein [Pelagimonas varians]SMX36415.1 Transcriptional activatory protein AadR [Pelagimonas varians]
MRPEDIAIASSSLLIGGLSPGAQNTLLQRAQVREFDRGSTLFLQGERANAIYIVLDGWVKLYRIARNGSEAVVGVFTKGRSFGEAVAFRHDTYPVSAEAVTHCRLMRIEADNFLHLIRSDPDVAVSILTATYAHLHSLVAQVEALKARTGAQRVAEFLLELAKCDDGVCGVTLPYDKVLIAGRLGMKPESLSRAFGALKAHGVKIKQNKAEIEDVEALRAYAEEDPANAWGQK